MTGGIDWISATGFLLCGVIAGVMFTYYIVTSSRSKQANSDLEQRDLEAKVEALVLRLREQEDAGDPEERRRLEGEAATALRRLAELGGSVSIDGRPERTAPLPLQPARSSSAVAGFLWGVGSMVVIALLAYLVYSSSSPRVAGEGASGNGAPPMAAASAQRSASDPDIIRLRHELEQSPADINKRLELAQRELVLEDLVSVFSDTNEVLKRDPNNARAMSYQAFVLLAMGRSADAQTMLNHALSIDPDLVDAWVQLAMVDTSLGKPDDAEKAIDEAIKRKPDQEQALRNLLTEMRARGAAAPGPEPAPQQEAQASPADSIGGTIEVPATASPSAVIFVFARAAGVSSGPPVAVARLRPTVGKMTFELSAANSMLGQTLPQKLRIEARLDSDGNPLTHDPSDMSAVADNVALGAHDLDLRLK